MAKLDNNQNTEKLTTRDKAQVNMLANSISAQLISFFGKNFGSLNSNFSKLTAKNRGVSSDLKSEGTPEKVLSQVKSLQKSNLKKRMAAFNAETAYYKRENSFYEDLAEVQKDLLKFQDKREQYFDYAEKVVGKLHEQEISVQDRKRLAYDTERKNYIKALKLSKLQQQIEDTRAKTWFLEGGLTKNMIAYRADSEKYIQTVKDNFKNKLLQPFRTMKKWWSNTKSVFSFGKDLIGSFFGRKPTGTQKQSEQVKNNKAEVNKDDTERIKEQQETEEYHDDIRSKFDKLLDFFLGSKTVSTIKEKKSTPTQVTGEGSGSSNWLSWLAIASNFMPGKKLLKGIWGLDKFGIKGIGATLKGIGKFALNPVATTKAIGKSVAAVPGTIKALATKKISNIGKSVVSKATAAKQFAVNKVNVVKSTASKVAGKAISFKNGVTNSETGQTVAKGFDFVKEKAAKAIGSFKTKGFFGTAKSVFTGAVMNMIPKGLMNQFKSLFSKFAKPITKLIAKFGGIAGLKVGLKGLATAGKGIPGLGIILGVIFAIHRAVKGDWWGALLELASGLAGGLLPPGIGMGLTMAIEMGLQYKDFKNAKMEESPALAVAKTSNVNANQNSLTAEDNKENSTKGEKETLALEKQHTSQSNEKFQIKNLNTNGKNLQTIAVPNYQIASSKVVNDKLAQRLSNEIDQISSKIPNSAWVENKVLQDKNLNTFIKEAAKSTISNEIKKVKPNSEKLKKSEKAKPTETTKSVVSSEIEKVKPNSEELKKSEKVYSTKIPKGPTPDISKENLTKEEKEVIKLEEKARNMALHAVGSKNNIIRHNANKLADLYFDNYYKRFRELPIESQEKLSAIYNAETMAANAANDAKIKVTKSVVSKSKPIPKIERAPVNNNNTQQNNNNSRDDAKVASILERIDSKIGNVAENTANPRVTSVPVPMETSVTDYSGGANAQMQGI